MNLSVMIKEVQELGYESVDAGARVCQDIVLKAYGQRVDTSDKRWMDDDIKDVFGGIVNYLRRFE